MAVELAANALTTLEAAKEYLQVKASDTTKDNIIKMLINASSGAIEQWCNRKFKKQTHAEYHRGHGRQRLLLDQSPVVSVTSVELNSAALDSAEYEIEDADAGILYRETGWPWKGYSVGLVGEPGVSTRNIKVVYVAGYVLPKDATADNPRTLPWALEMACWKLVEYYFKTDISHFSTTFAQSGAVFKPSEMPPHVAKLLEPFTRRHCA